MNAKGGVHRMIRIMSSLKLIAKISKSLPFKRRPDQAGVLTRAFTAATGPLQSKKEDDAADKTKEAADAVKDGAREVRKTCEFMRDTVETTASTMSKATKDATEKVSETAETVTNKTKGTVSGAWGMAKNTTDIIKDKVMDK